MSDTLSALLCAGLSAHPDAPAVLSSKRCLSFAELSEKVNAIAQYLMCECHIQPGDRVISIAKKEPVTIATVIAIWRVGAVYVPVDVKSPEVRVAQVISTIAPKLVISCRSSDEELMKGFGCDAAVIRYESLDQLKVVEGVQIECPKVKPQAIGTIIHTSGSTGLPKGVCLSHGSTVKYFYNHNKLLGFDSDSRSMSNGPLHFDVSIQDTFLPLFFGASVVLHRDLFVPSVIFKTIIDFQVTHLIAVSSVLKVISSDPGGFDQLKNSALRVLMTGGEACSPHLINSWKLAIPEIRAFYGYGPTECNSLCMAYEVSEVERDRHLPYPIGRVFDDHEAILIDENHSVISEPFVSGVLAVSGPQVMEGYWRNPEATHSAILYLQDRRYYLTGDWCHRDENGLYVFDGRRDAERKINGRRINLNEIRAAIARHPALSSIVIDTIAIFDEECIYAFCEVSGQVEMSEAKLRDFIEQSVVEYMYPRYIILSDGAPKTSTHKLDERQIRDRCEALIRSNPGQNVFCLKSAWEC